MTHHRCTGCKQESYPRHKYYGGVYCDDYLPGRKRRRFGWFREMWDRFATWLEDKFRGPSSERAQKSIERAIYSKQKTMEARARKIPANPIQMTPQKR